MSLLKSTTPYLQLAANFNKGVAKVRLYPEVFAAPKLIDLKILKFFTCNPKDIRFIFCITDASIQIVPDPDPESESDTPTCQWSVLKIINPRVIYQEFSQPTPVLTDSTVSSTITLKLVDRWDYSVAKDLDAVGLISIVPAP